MARGGGGGGGGVESSENGWKGDYEVSIYSDVMLLYFSKNESGWNN